MLRNSYLHKYAKRTKSSDIDEQLLKEDGEYILNNNRPLSQLKISKLPKGTLFHFMEDFLTNEKVTRLLYTTNAKKEINHFLHSSKVVQKTTNIRKPPKRTFKNKANSIVKNRERNAQISKIKKEILDYKTSKTLRKEELENKSEKFFYLMKNQQKERIRLYYQPINDIRLKNYNRILNKCMSQVITNKDFKLPSVGLDIKDVYSRLYHNEVYSDIKDPNKSTDSLIKHQQHALDNVNNDIIAHPHSNSNNNNGNGHNDSKRFYRNFSLKNVIKATNGKEFTVKITDNIIKQCMIKHSGGPRNKVEKYECDLNKEDNDDEDNNLLKMIKLKDENGNTNLHNAVLKDSREFVRYFLEKNIDPNIQNNDGDTALHLAMRMNDIEIIRMLLDKGGNISIRNNDNIRPYDLAEYPIKKRFKLETMMIHLNENI